MYAFKMMWGMKAIGVLVRDQHVTGIAVAELVILSVTMELGQGFKLHPT